MNRARKASKSFSIDRDVHAYVIRTRGAASASERVNELLRKAMEREGDEQLEEEAAQFFSTLHPNHRKEERAFQRAAKRSLKRD